MVNSEHHENIVQTSPAAIALVQAASIVYVSAIIVSGMTCHSSYHNCNILIYNMHNIIDLN